MEEKNTDKATSIRLPLDWWETLKRLSSLREIQDKGSTSLNALLLEAVGEAIPQFRLELTERERRRKAHA